MKSETTIETRFRQLAAMFRPVLTPDEEAAREAEVEVVRQRWIRLKSNWNARNERPAEKHRPRPQRKK